MLTSWSPGCSSAGNRVAPASRRWVWHRRLAGGRRARPVLDAECQVCPPPKTLYGLHDPLR